MSKMYHIGLAMIHDYEYARAVLRGVINYARPTKPWIFHFTRYSADSFSTALKSGIDGFIGNLSNPNSIAPIVESHKPFINISNHELNTTIPRIGVDDVRVGRMAARYFIERGYKHFAFYGTPDLQYALDRQRGFGEELAGAGATFHSFGQWLQARGERDCENFGLIHEWLAALPRPLAVAAMNDRYALFLSEVCRNDGIAVPETLSILGCDNDAPICMTAFPTLSSIVIAGETIGYEAAAALDGMLHGKPAIKESILVPPKNVVTRQSSDMLAIGDPELAAAVRYIRQHAGERISVTDVVLAGQVARRSLERKFRVELGRSPQEEIRRAHLDTARELLANTDLPMPAVAQRSGFESAVRLTTVFREETGMTPTAFRRQFRLHEDGVEEPEVATAP